MEKRLEYRMYGFVPCNISEIQKSIQFGHAVVEYGQTVKGLGLSEEVYNSWAKYDKTFIILNGGTTNHDMDSKFYGSLQKYRDILAENNILFSEFYEPDLNNALTAFVFLVDERVYNKEKYPDFVNIGYYWDLDAEPTAEEFLKWDAENTLAHEKWIEDIGGKKNLFLREFLLGKRLA